MNVIFNMVYKRILLYNIQIYILLFDWFLKLFYLKENLADWNWHRNRISQICQSSSEKSVKLFVKQCSLSFISRSSCKH